MGLIPLVQERYIIITLVVYAVMLFCQAAAQHKALEVVGWATAPLAAYLSQSVRLALAAAAVAAAAATSRWVSLRWAARLVVADSRHYNAAWASILTQDDDDDCVGGGVGATRMEEALSLRALLQVHPLYTERHILCVPRRSR